jgi:hypothetical protein
MDFITINPVDPNFKKNLASQNMNLNVNNHVEFPFILNTLRHTPTMFFALKIPHTPKFNIGSGVVIHPTPDHTRPHPNQTQVYVL